MTRMAARTAGTAPPLVAVILNAARPYDRLIIGGVTRDFRYVRPLDSCFPESGIQACVGWPPGEGLPESVDESFPPDGRSGSWHRGDWVNHRGTEFPADQIRRAQQGESISDLVGPSCGEFRSAAVRTRS